MRSAIPPILAILVVGCVEPEPGQVGSTGLPGTRTQGSALQGVRLQGVRLQGVRLQGVRLQGVRLQGVRLQGVELQGVELTGTEISGWFRARIETVETSNCVTRGKKLQCDETSSVRYEWWLVSATEHLVCPVFDDATQTCSTSLDGPYDGGLAGARIPAQLTGDDPDTGASSTIDVELVVGVVERDSSTSTMVVDDYRSNDDVVLYELSVRDDDGVMQNLCGADGLRGTFVAGSWDELGDFAPLGVTFACETGVIAKCIRSWGYKPWRSMISPATAELVAMGPLHQACTRAARADYCGDRSHTTDGTLIDMFDSYGFNQPETVHGETSGSSTWHGEAIFDQHGASAIGDEGRLANETTTYYLDAELNPAGYDQSIDDGWTDLTCLPELVSSAAIADLVAVRGEQGDAQVGVHSRTTVEYDCVWMGGLMCP